MYPSEFLSLLHPSDLHKFNLYTHPNFSENCTHPKRTTQLTHPFLPLASPFLKDAYSHIPRGIWQDWYRQDSVVEFLAEKTAQKTYNQLLRVMQQHGGDDSTDKVGSRNKPKKKWPTNVDNHIRYDAAFVIEQVEVVRGENRPKCAKNPRLESF